MHRLFIKATFILGLAVSLAVQVGLSVIHHCAKTESQEGMKGKPLSVRSNAVGVFMKFFSTSFILLHVSATGSVHVSSLTGAAMYYDVGDPLLLLRRASCQPAQVQAKLGRRVS